MQNANINISCYKKIWVGAQRLNSLIWIGLCIYIHINNHNCYANTCQRTNGWYQSCDAYDNRLCVGFVRFCCMIPEYMQINMYKDIVISLKSSCFAWTIATCSVCKSIWVRILIICSFCLFQLLLRQLMCFLFQGLVVFGYSCQLSQLRSVYFLPWSKSAILW